MKQAACSCATGRLPPSIASLVICHGFNAHSGHYARAAEVFAARGIAVTVLDLRGRGRSDGERFYVEAFDDYVADLEQAVVFARAQAPDPPLFLLGHSAGGWWRRPMPPIIRRR